VLALVLLDALLDGVPWDAESKRGLQAIREPLQAGDLARAKAAWFDHGFFGPAATRTSRAGSPRCSTNTPA
jgi:hypothetical protein